MRESREMPTRTMLSCALAIGLSLASTVGHAITIEWDAGTGDWFEPTNWNPAQVPVGFGGGTAGDDALINNGGSALADIDTAPSGSVADTRTLGVGANGSSGAIDGTLNSDRIDVRAAFGVAVGRASGDVTGATGTIAIDNAELNVTGTSLDVGVVAAPNADASATGAVQVNGGGITGAFGSIGAVAANPTDGVIGPTMTASGTVVADNDVIGGYTIGSNVAGNAASTATGRLTVNSGNLDPRGRDTVVGRSSGGDGSADGQLVISNGAFVLGDPLNAGSFPPSLFVGSASGGVADGEVQVAAMDMAGKALGDLVVGSAGYLGTHTEVTNGGGTATGRFVSGSGDVAVTGDVSIGEVVANNGGSATGSADFGTGATVRKVGDGSGSFSLGVAQDIGLVNNIGQGEASGTASAFGLEGFDNYRIGVTLGTVQDAPRSATGMLSVGAGGIQGNSDGDSSLYIGAALGIPNNNQLLGGGGSADGKAVVNGGDIAGMGRVGVGVSEGLVTGGGHGAGNGELVLHNGSLTTRALEIGAATMNQAATLVADSVAHATGHFEMDNGVLSITDSATGVPGQMYLGYAFSFGTSGGVEDRPAQGVGSAQLTDVDVNGGALSVGVARQAFAEGDTHADGTLDVLRGGLDIASLAVGIASGGTNASARGRVRLTDTHLTTSGIVEVGGGTDASGELTAVNTDIAVGDDLRVGAFRGLIADDPPMLGRLQMRSGTLSVGSNALIGAQFTGGHGELLLDQVTATVGGLLRVGASSNLGTLFGTGAVELRQSSLDVTGTVLLESGTVRLVDSSATFANDLIMSSITSFGAEVTADATLALQRSQVTVAGLFTIGEGDTLRIAIEAATRGDGYGALDVGSAVLGGGLVLDFAGFTGVDPDYVFDLIVADSLGTITGDFTSLLVDGLSPLYQITAGVVQDDLGNGLVDIYRVQIARAVPAPATWLLLAPGLGWWMAFRRRARRSRA